MGAHAKESSLGKKVTHVSITPENVFIGYDGAVEVLGIPGMQRLQASPSKPSYYAPEQVSGSATDLSTEVFALGVLVWELFAGTPLFLRDTPAATRMAISEGRVPYVCDLEPERTQAHRRHARHRPALRQASTLRVGRGVRQSPRQRSRGERHQRGGAQDGRRHLALRARAASRRRSRAATRLRTARPQATRLRTNRPQATRLCTNRPQATRLRIDRPRATRLRTTAPALQPACVGRAHGARPRYRAFHACSRGLGSAGVEPRAGPESGGPPASVRSAAPPKADPNIGVGGRSITFDNDSDDEFDMEIERNVATTSMAPRDELACAGRARRAEAGGREAPPGLELGAPSRMARSRGRRAPLRRRARHRHQARRACAYLHGDRRWHGVLDVEVRVSRTRLQRDRTRCRTRSTGRRRPRAAPSRSSRSSLPSSSGSSVSSSGRLAWAIVASRRP